MTVEEMHYDFKQKLNKIDSNQFRNLLVPEIDWKLNEAQELFIKMIAEPRLNITKGFEINQRTIDDIRTIVVNQNLEQSTCLIPIVYDVITHSSSVLLPLDYMYYVSSTAFGTKGNCQDILLTTKVRQHDDEHEISLFDKSNFEWRHINLRFFDGGIRLFTDGTFNIESLCLNYIKKPLYITNCQNFKNGTYTLPSGIVLSVNQNCELPEQVHRDIVDLAVLISTGDLQIPDYQVKMNKTNMSN